MHTGMTVLSFCSISDDRNFCQVDGKVTMFRSLINGKQNELIN